MNENPDLRHAIERHNAIRREAETMRLLSLAQPVRSKNRLHQVLSMTGSILIAIGTRLQQPEYCVARPKLTTR